MCPPATRLPRKSIWLRPLIGLAWLAIAPPAVGRATDSTASDDAPRAETPAEKRVEYRREVLPILADHCFNCHGLDAGSREGGLRLDDSASAVAGGDSGVAAILPGDPAASELIARVTSLDEGSVMPPPDAKNPLTAEEIEVLRRWITQDAEYQSHWAFEPVREVPIPAEASSGQPQPHPVDALVRQTLARERLEPAAEAADHVLCRRLYLDLIGLPPSPDELEEFRKNGFEATVEKLLASERFGEKWARHWLDAARYSDTNGYEKDLRRDQWIWRDWVIDAFNNDKPYNEFLVEQIAGDLLPDATQDQIVATGFLRNSMLNEEGAIVAEEFRMAEMFDRLDCVGKAVMGLTTQCAQCHTHKFDPLTHDEYYGMFAFLNDTHEAQSWVYQPDQLALIDEIKRSIATIEDSIRQEHPSWREDAAAWLDQAMAAAAQWQPIRMDDLGSVSGLNHPVQLSDDSILMLGHTSGDVYYLAKPDLSGATGLRLEALTHGDLPFRGPGRSSVGTWGILELEVFTRADGQDWQKQKLVNATADGSEAEQSHQEGKQKSGPVDFLIDGSDDTWWKADRGLGRRNQPSVAVAQFEHPLELPEGTELKVVMRMNDMLGCCRVSLTKDADPKTPAIDLATQTIAAKPSADWSTDDWDAVFAAWRKGQSHWERQNGEIEAWWAKFPAGWTSVMHLARRESDKARPTFLLDRGQWNQPTEPIEPHTPAALHPLAPENSDAQSEPATEEPPRLRFAKWLASDDSPLTARVAVNRVWQAMFGEGLVSTPEDFGTRAPLPHHAELLDWLATDFMHSGWSHKHLIRTIVTSKTYRQDSRVTPEQLEQDPNNRWLARGPRFRADAEVVRDVALAAAGLVSFQMGGPGVIPPVPQNVLDYNYVYPSYWKAAEGSERYRRTVYGFRKRSMPDPVLSSFDAPNGDTACVQRVRSNTPLAALAGLNETIFVEAAQGLARRVLREGGDSDDQRADYAFLLCMARLPSDAERAEVIDMLKAHRQRIADGWLNPREIATGNPAQLPELPEGTTPQDAAAWTLVARVLLNLDETVSKN